MPQTVLAESSSLGEMLHANASLVEWLSLQANRTDLRGDIGMPECLRQRE
jgi:hypothetical protein